MPLCMLVLFCSKSAMMDVSLKAPVGIEMYTVISIFINYQFWMYKQQKTSIASVETPLSTSNLFTRHHGDWSWRRRRRQGGDEKGAVGHLRRMHDGWQLPWRGNEWFHLHGYNDYWHACFNLSTTGSQAKRENHDCSVLLHPMRATKKVRPL